MEITQYLFEQYKEAHEEREKFLAKFNLRPEEAESPEDIMRQCFYGITAYQLRLMRRYLKKADWNPEIAWRKYNRMEIIHPERVERNKKKRTLQFIFGK